MTAGLKVTIPTSSSASTITIVGAGGGGSGGSGIPIITGGAGISTSTWGMNSGHSDINPRRIEIHGDAIFEGNITWKGRDMQEWFATVESRLGMLQPNPKLEEGWEELADLRMKYVELERKLLEQQQVFDILKQE
jgi:hypothetical protein